MSETKNPVTMVPANLKPEDRLGFKIIAVIGGTGLDWAAYKGLTSWPDDQVAMNGDKLDQATAEALFYAPEAAGLKYRR